MAALATPAFAQTDVERGWSLIPTGLTTGDQFRLLFLSSTKRNGSVTDIATYNTFIQDLAAAGHTDIRSYSTGFRVVGCTAAVDATANTSTTGTGVPIYWLDGTKVADDYVDFYDGSWDDEANDKNESGTDGPDTSVEANYPITGCDAAGTEVIVSSVSRALGSVLSVRIGRPNSSTTGHGPISGDNLHVVRTATRPMYGLSEVFTVVDTTPPTLTSVTVTSSGLLVDLNFSEAYAIPSDQLEIIQFANTLAGQFSVTAGGNAATVTQTAADVLGAPRMSLRVSPTIGQGQAVVVTYTDPTVGDDAVAIEDAAGNEAATFTTGRSGVPAVTNNSTVDTTPPSLVSATVFSTGQTIQLQFSEDLQQSNLPPANAFDVTVGGSSVTVSDVFSSFGAVFQLGVSPTIRQGQAVVVAYEDPTAGNDTNAIQDTVGNDTPDFTTGRSGVPAVSQQLHRHHHRARRPDRPHGNRQREHPDQPLLDRPGQHRRLRHHRLQDRGFA